MTITINDFYVAPFGLPATLSYHYINSSYDFYIIKDENEVWYVQGFKNNKNHTVVIPTTYFSSIEECLELINNFLNK